MHTLAIAQIHSSMVIFLALVKHFFFFYPLNHLLDEATSSTE